MEKLKDRRPLFFLLAFFVLELFLINSRGVWAPDEARYARVAYEMKERGSYLIPYLNGGIYREKPPLFFDLAILFSLFEENVPHYSVKLVSLFSALLILFLTSLIARRLNLNNIFLAPLILIGTPKFIWQSQFGQIDMLLCAFVLLQFYLGISLILEEKVSYIKVLLLGLFSFAAIVSKGPAGVLPVFICLTICSLFVRKYKILFTFTISIAICLFLTSIWLFLSGLVAGFDYPESLIFKQTLTRYIEPWHHHAPFYYYFLVIWADGFPFIFFFVPALIQSFKEKWVKEKEFLLPLVFILVYLLFFSISSGKRSIYIFPIYPIISIYLSSAINKWFVCGFPKRFILAASFFIGLFPVIAIPFVWQKANYQFPLETVLLILALLCFLIGTIKFIYFFLSKGEFYLQLFPIFSLLLFFALLPAIQSLDRTKVPYDFVSSMKPLTKCGIQVGVYPSLIPSLNYYLEANTVVFEKSKNKEAIEFMKEGNLILIKEKTLPEDIKANSTILFRGQIGNDFYVLIASSKGN